MVASETPGATSEAPAPWTSPEYVDAVIDLLGAIGYGELSAFQRMGEDAKLAPTLTDQIQMDRLATYEFAHLEAIAARLVELGADADETLGRFQDSFETFHEYTSPADWWEGLVKVYVGDGMARDFYREISSMLDPETRAILLAATDGGGHQDFVLPRVKAACDDDARLASRLALWGRRLMGEALSQAQQVIAQREALAGLLAGGPAMPGLDLAELTKMFGRITDRHVERMKALGLDH
jgi:hypothetical protein